MSAPVSPPSISDALRARLQKIRWFLCDVDGVLTDGSVLMGPNFEAKSFDIRDGLGLRLAQSEGIKVGWISARPSPATLERANDLKIDFLHQSSGKKTDAIEELLKQTGLTWAEVSYMGDDVLDLGALGRAGFAAVPGDAVWEARAVAHYVCTAPGGGGAVREVVELLLRAQGRWEKLLDKFVS